MRLSKESLVKLLKSHSLPTNGTVNELAEIFNQKIANILTVQSNGVHVSKDSYNKFKNKQFVKKSEHDDDLLVCKICKNSYAKKIFKGLDNRVFEICVYCRRKQKGEKI